ncbi:MAG: folate-binding protein [Yoonia sp.]|uniref:CAF17-like 4Fe-4S cluster assembly/insertion protein YgfZ n=1 Tax=Yoonia sp. TaxID=2212373 RepID=UPI003266455B
MTQPRTVFSVTGTDRVSFLQGLITNDVDKAQNGIVYAALLTPQGKFIADFFVIGRAEELLIDVATSHAPALSQRLNMYRLRADVQLTETPLVVSTGTTAASDGALPDPRHPDLGWRVYSDTDVSDETDWTALRVQNMVPETGVELLPDSYILEAGFERLNGIDFKKGCYVGQEIAARMKHKTELKKGLAQVAIDGSARPGDEITSNGKPAGTLHSVAGNTGLAYLRFDRAKGMETQNATLTLLDTAPVSSA